MAGVLQEFIEILVSGIVSLAQGVALGIRNMASALFITYSENSQGVMVPSLSTFGGIIAIFAGLALAIGVTTRVYTWVTSLGK